MSEQPDFEGLASYLLQQINSFLTEWLPGGHLQGREYCCGDIRGGKGDSFRVNTQTGVWCEFAGDQRGGDLISLYAAINDKTQGEAYDALNQQYGYKLPMIVPPTETPVPAMRHREHGLPSMSWSYHDELGRAVFHIARYESSNGKQFLPWSWTGDRWNCRAVPAPRPLYNLHDLAKRPTAPVLVCEGEKSADAVKQLTNGAYIGTTWPNGSLAVSKANWTALRGRNVLIWPDADQPGRDAADKISEILIPICKEVKILDVSGQPNGWDAADALADGWEWDGFKDWAVPRATKLEIVISEDPGPVTGSTYVLWENLGIPVTKNGAPIVNMDTVDRVISGIPELKNIVWLDKFHQRMFTRWDCDDIREWTDVDNLKLCMKMQREYGIMRMSDDMVYKTIRVIANQNQRNEPRDWMDSLEWDKQPRIERFFIDYLGADESDYVMAASRNWWISLAARIYWPGCQMDNMVILKGPQGKFKSTALRIIGGPWYASSGGSIFSKDFYQILQGKLIIEIGELDSFARSEVNTIKRVVADPNDRYRAPYERVPEDHPRQCVFVGTTNEDLVLKDHTGGRRFWPVNIKTIHPNKIIADRDQLYAEAVSLYKDGIEWHIMPTTQTLQVQEDNRQYDEWEQYIQNYFTEHYETETTVFDVAKDCLHVPIDKLDKAIQMRIGRCLVSLGWKREILWKDGKTVRTWIRNINNTTSVVKWE